MEYLGLFFKFFICALSLAYMVIYTCAAHTCAVTANELTDSVDIAEYATEIYRNKSLAILYTVASSINFLVAYLVIR